MKRTIARLLLVVFVVAIASALSACSCGGKRDDGVTTCKNCGRKGVVLYGYCESCANSFLKWQKKNGY